MRRINLVVPLLALSIVVAGVGRAEAARIDVNGLNGRGAIIWDDAGDVLTMSNLCVAQCETTDFTSQLAGVLFSMLPNSPGVLDVQTLNVFVVLGLDNCSIAQCEERDEFLSRTGLDMNLGESAGLIELTTARKADTNLFELTDPGFLTDNASLLASAHVGIRATWTEPDGGQAWFSLTTYSTTTPPPPQPVPEPATLALMAAGAGVAGLRRRRRAKR